MSTILRRATADDIEAILDFLTEYELPRGYFEPFYYRDPTYRPDQSWVVEVDGRLAAHLRLFDRWIYLHGVTAHVAGVGNVITARAFRGRGFAGQLLRAFTLDAAAEGFMYSLLWTHVPDLYERYGWAPIKQDAHRRGRALGYAQPPGRRRPEPFANGGRSGAPALPRVRPGRCRSMVR